jgi:hypothetical protein
MTSYNDPFEVVAKGAASPQQQVEYLHQLLRLKENEISTLKLKVKTLELQSKYEHLKFEECTHGLLESVGYYKAQGKQKKRWFSWFKRGSNDNRSNET